MKASHRGFVVFATTGLIAGIALTHALDTPRIFVQRDTEIVIRELNTKDYAKMMLAPLQYKCLDLIVNRESHWNPKAVESSTKALGIGQLQPQTWRNLNYKSTLNPNAQVLATLMYIQRHYGSPGVCSAERHSRTFGWY